MRKKVEESMSIIGSHIKKARMREGVTQEVLAESIGVTSQYLSDLERGLVGTSISTLMKICRELHVTADYILFGSGGKEIEDSLIIDKIRYRSSDQLEIINQSLDLIFKAMEMDPDQKKYN